MKKNPNCPQCHGRGWYTYTTSGTPHMCPCNLCCEHEGKPWESEGKFYCLAGCGKEITSKDNEE